MAQINGQKSSAELEEEVSQQRSRVEARIGEIRDRLSPGQLVDEMLSYTRDGGGKFAANFGQQITANPLPAALVGVGLAWLIAGNAHPQPQAVTSTTSYSDQDDYPYARVGPGGIRRVSHASDDTGQWWSEFESNSGEKFKAQADTAGRRSGHFTNEAGKKFAGFIDDAGNRVRSFQDEAGNALDDSMGWASHSWNEARESLGRKVQGVASAAAHLTDDVGERARDFSGSMGNTMQAQGDQLARQITTLFDRQPLIAGALAFAAGAALGAALPHTAQEDTLLGKQADKVRAKGTAAADELYQQGREQVTETYAEVSDKAADLYSETKDKVAGLGDPSNLH